MKIPHFIFCVLKRICNLFFTFNKSHATHRGKQIQGNGEELRPRYAHGLLALLAHDLDEGLGLLGAVVPVARIGGLHDR